MSTQEAAADAPLLVYVTAANPDEAERLADAAVGARLAACANILGPITSVYWWQGKLERGQEVALLLKTRSSLLPALTERLKSLHSYSVPCVVALPIGGGNPHFLEWIRSEVRGEG